jgi:hypothetical protein
VQRRSAREFQLETSRSPRQRGVSEFSNAVDSEVFVAARSAISLLIAENRFAVELAAEWVKTPNARKTSAARRADRKLTLALQG